MRDYRALMAALLLCSSAYSTNCAAADLPARQRLANDYLRYEFTADIGGRGLAFSIPGYPNLLKVDEQLLAQPIPPVTAEGENFGYLGHIVWIGPQQNWWRFQSVNTSRRDSRADWPPDPYTVLGENTLHWESPSHAVLSSTPSPVTGLQLTRHAKLDGDRLVHTVTASNTRDNSVAWDIWFNSRVASNTQVLVPVKDFSGDVRIAQFDGNPAPDQQVQKMGFFDFKRTGKSKAKAFIQPAAGWLAAFAADQVFIIEFPLQPRSAIHPAQGQVELYLDYDPENPAAGLLELEVHGPYVQLAPGETMSASEQWRAIAYSGENNLQAKVAFLQRLGYGR
ncbi:DUF4380 domain-containing protein [Microbulbifer bruguierae]|uniref:DUF4380 domain-containing protein n=1 Tax=Microbulbifer bruguierae TaxID=3029061 RepID=A0ABY8NJX9_9GAMM|nr:DUF4380 domain-containing protein [Microbulbifer bruguierae]WGL18382.1 DUF4380 domain-containing protein [Microbulbifer bruguierae]